MRVAVVVVFAIVLTVSAACAQPDADHRGVFLQGGAYAPADSSARGELGSAWLNIGADVRVASGRRIDHYAGVGWVRAGGRTLTEDLGRINPAFDTEVISVETEFRMIPFTYTQRTRPAAGTGFYAGGGVGLNFTSGKVRATSPALETLSYDNNDAVLSVHVIGGAVVANTMVVEARYTLLFSEVKIADIQDFSYQHNLSGLALTLGVRF